MGAPGAAAPGVLLGIRTGEHGMVHGLAHVCAGAAWLCSVQNAGEVSKVESSKNSQASACMQTAEHWRRQKDPAPGKASTDSPGVYTAGQGHGRCYRMRGLDQISTLVAAADGNEGVGGWE